MAITHLKFRASFPTSTCIAVINHSSSKHYSTKPTFSFTQQTIQLRERFGVLKYNAGYLIVTYFVYEL